MGCGMEWNRMGLIPSPKFGFSQNRYKDMVEKGKFVVFFRVILTKTCDRDLIETYQISKRNKQTNNSHNMSPLNNTPCFHLSTDYCTKHALIILLIY